MMGLTRFALQFCSSAILPRKQLLLKRRAGARLCACVDMPSLLFRLLKKPSSWIC